MSLYMNASKVFDYLYICGARAVTVERVKSLGITCIVNATLEVPNLLLKEIEYVKVPVNDTPSVNISVYFDPIADKIHEVAKKGGKTLVHCIAGASRSAALVLAYLMKYHKMSLREAFRLLKTCRPVVHPNSGFFQQLIDYEIKLFGEATVKMVSVPSLGPDVMVPDFYAEQHKIFVWLASLKNVLHKK